MDQDLELNPDSFFVKKNSVNLTRNDMDQDLELDPDSFFPIADPGSGSTSKLNGS